MTDTLTVDDLLIEVIWTGPRKTLALTIERDGALTLRAPHGASPQRLEGFVRDKQLWVYTKLAQREARLPPPPPREYVNGEGFSYLGRSYRLLLVPQQAVPLKLEGGRFRLVRGEAARGRAHFVAWYKAHAQRWLERRLQRYAPQVGATPGRLSVRDLGHRWGSCGQDNSLYFHWSTILLPVGMVDYVLVHELVHLREHDHGPAFWARVARVLPDYDQRKEWLARHGAAFAAL